MSEPRTDGPLVFRDQRMDALDLGGGADAQFEARSLKLTMAMPSFPSMKGSTSKQQDFVAPPLDAITAKVLSSTHFRSGKSAEEMKTVLYAALNKLDAVIKCEGLHFKCSIQTPHGPVQVHINIFSDNGEHIVELLRHSGSSLGFNRVWERLLADPDIEGLQPQTQAPAHGLAESMDVEVDL